MMENKEPRARSIKLASMFMENEGDFEKGMQRAIEVCHIVVDVLESGNLNMEHGRSIDEPTNPEHWYKVLDILSDELHKMTKNEIKK